MKRCYIFYHATNIYLRIKQNIYVNLPLKYLLSARKDKEGLAYYKIICMAVLVCTLLSLSHVICSSELSVNNGQDNKPNN